MIDSPANPAVPQAHSVREALPAASGRRVLVTGGAGFIGSHLVFKLLQRGDQVIVIDNLSTGRAVNLPAFHPRLTMIVADVSTALLSHAAALSDGLHEVYHLAAAVGVGLIVGKPIESIETNITQTAALLAALSQLRNPPRVLVASSSEVYGKSTSLPFREDDDVVYGPTTVARWSYAMSKAVDEHLALAYASQRQLPVVVARFFNTVGPGQVGDYGMVLPRLIAAALNGQAVAVYGDGKQTRCFCDVRDVSGILPVLLGHTPALGQIFNIGSEQSITISDLARAVLRITHSAGAIEYLPHAAVYGPGFEDLAHRRPDTSRLRAAVSFSPQWSLDQTIADTAAWIIAGKLSGVDWQQGNVALPQMGAGADEGSSNPVVQNFEGLATRERELPS